MNRLIKTLRHVFLPHHTNKYKPLLIRLEGLAFASAAIMLVVGIANYSATGSFNVLSYATDITIGDLLQETNQERVNNGLAPLTLNADLNIAAKAKAQHMITNNYWAHVAPDGTAPWDFIDDVGYIYLKAGENLAYGFDTSAGTVDGWMDSPGHRANILDSDFLEVGFGIVNGENYQEDNNTVVVAMYTTPYEVPGVETVAVSNPDDSPKNEVREILEQEEEPVPQFVNTSNELIVAASGGGLTVSDPVLDQSISGKVITNFEALITGKASISMYLTVGLLLMIGFAYSLRHVAAIRQYLQAGEHVMQGHPLLEAGLIYALIWLVLSATWGVII